MHPNLLLNMLRAVYWYCDALQQNLQAQSYPRTTRAMTFVLLNIAQGEHRAINIARNLGISRQAVGQMLDELKSRDFINVREDPSNRRSRIVDFSPAFAEHGAVCAQILAKLDADVGERVGKRNFEALERALSQDWGAPPVFRQLTRSEIRAGREYWQEDDLPADDRAADPPGIERKQPSARARTQLQKGRSRVSKTAVRSR